MMDNKGLNQRLPGLKKNYLDKDNHGKWKLSFDLHLTENGGTDYFNGNRDKNDLHNYYKVHDTLLSEVLQIWSEISVNGNNLFLRTNTFGQRTCSTIL